MSEIVTLTLRSALDDTLDVDGIDPAQLATMSESEIAALPAWSGRESRRLGDYFAVRGERSATIRIEGDVRRCRGLGAGMTAGSIDIHGDAGDDLGTSMAGGWIRVRGNAGDRVGAGVPGASRGMTGGEIVVDGSVGADVGARMRRGLVYVGGDAGPAAARAIIAGTVVVMGGVGAEPAAGSKRGSLVVAGDIDIPATYRYACRYLPPHVRVVLTHLRHRHGIHTAAAIVEGRYDRYCGDAGTVAKGEILRWIHE
jgi:formylmethanofuran dehydrogenase subunit C